MVLAEDLDGNGRLDLILSTMNGNVYALETPAEYHTLKAWPSQVWITCMTRCHLPVTLISPLTVSGTDMSLGRIILYEDDACLPGRSLVAMG